MLRARVILADHPQRFRLHAARPEIHEFDTPIGGQLLQQELEPHPSPLNQGDLEGRLKAPGHQAGRFEVVRHDELEAGDQQVAKLVVSDAQCGGHGVCSSIMRGTG
jgi:hypothetical protein